MSKSEDEQEEYDPASIFIDPGLEKLVRERILFTLAKRELFAKRNKNGDVPAHLLPLPNRYVIHAQPGSQVQEMLRILFKRHSSHTEVAFCTAAEFDDVWGYVVVITDGSTLKFPEACKILKPDFDEIVIVLNDLPPSQNHHLWDNYCDIQYTCALPSSSFADSLIRMLFVLLGAQYKIAVSLSDEDYAYLVRVADSCLAIEIAKFVRRVVSDALFGGISKIDIGYIKAGEYFVTPINKKEQNLSDRPRRLLQDDHYTLETRKRVRLE